MLNWKRSNTLRRCLAASVAAGLAVLMPTVRAAPSEPSEVEADRLRDLFARGQAAFDASAYESAIEAFEGAYEISEDATLLYNIALCHDRLEQWDLALEYLDRYSALAPESEAADLERRRSSLEVRRERAARAAADESVVGPPKTDPVTAVGTPTEPDAERREPPGRIMTPVAWTLVGVGAVAFGAGAGLGIASLSRSNRADCREGGSDTLCSDAGADDARASRNLAIGADVALGVGAIAAIATIAIVAVRASRKRKHARDVAWAPATGVAFGGAVLSGRF